MRPEEGGREGGREGVALNSSHQLFEGRGEVGSHLNELEADGKRREGGRGRTYLAPVVDTLESMAPIAIHVPVPVGRTAVGERNETWWVVSGRREMKSQKASGSLQCVAGLLGEEGGRDKKIMVWVFGTFKGGKEGRREGGKEGGKEGGREGGREGLIFLTASACE